MSGVVNIFNYFNYHDYLADYYAFKKKAATGFSHRQFMRRAGLSSPNYLLRIIQKQRNLSRKYIDSFVKALGLSDREAVYFGLLVEFCNGKNVQVKETCLKKMFLLRYPNEEFRIEDRKLKFFQKWYYPVVRELVVSLDFRDDFNLLANSVVPRITASQAQGAVKYLLENGFIQRSTQGRYRQVNAIVSSGSEVQSAIVTRYHQTVLKQAAEAFQTIKQEERDISSLTLSVSTDTFFAIKKEVQAFRKRLLAMAAADEKPDMVCLAAFQLLPRSAIGRRP
jgi:uncharacterized protein (TIGR02147 family)